MLTTRCVVVVTVIVIVVITAAEQHSLLFRDRFGSRGPALTLPANCQMFSLNPTRFLEQICCQCADKTTHVRLRKLLSPQTAAIVVKCKKCGRTNPTCG